MAKTKRDILKGSIAMAYLALQKAIVYLGEVHAAFEKSHPDYASTLELIISSVDTASNLLAVFYTAAWGELPVDWHATARRR